MDRIELKRLAREDLGNNIFCTDWLLAVVVVLVTMAISSAVSGIIPGVGSMLIVGPMQVGVSYVFLTQARQKGGYDLGSLFYGFTNDIGGNLILGLLVTIFTMLWSLLFVIPGIVKAYSYSMAYFIKIDHPEYDWRRCIDESQRMMDGHKMDLFILDLSFIGWMIVGCFCFGIGTLWVSAYMLAAHTQFYNQLCGGNQYVEGTYVEQ